MGTAFKVGDRVEASPAFFAWAREDRRPGSWWGRAHLVRGTIEAVDGRPVMAFEAQYKVRLDRPIQWPHDIGLSGQPCQTPTIYLPEDDLVKLSEGL